MAITSANAYTDDFLNTINPYVRLAYYDTMPAHNLISTRIIFDYELLYVKAGTATIYINDTRYDAKPGDLFVLKPGIKHSIQAHSTPLVQPHIHFDLIYQSKDSCSIPISFFHPDELSQEQWQSVRNDDTQHFLVGFPEYLKTRNPLKCEQLLFDVIYAYASPGNYNELRLKQLFLKFWNFLLVEINMNNTEPKTTSQRRAIQIKQYLEYHPEKHITLNELAAVFWVEKSTLIRAYRSYFNTSPIHDHLLMRIDRAREMILFTNLSLTEIAELNGFNSLQDFSRAFKKIVGATPSSLRST